MTVIQLRCIYAFTLFPVYFKIINQKAIGFSRNMSVFNNIFVVFILFFLDNVNSYGSYRDRIPNGYAVRHPCNGSPWGGVGHIRQGGGGPRNKFGLDYARYRVSL